MAIVLARGNQSKRRSRTCPVKCVNHLVQLHSHPSPNQPSISGARLSPPSFSALLTTPRESSPYPPATHRAARKVPPPRAGHRRLMREDPHHLRPPLHLLIEPLQRVVRPRLLPMIRREG